MTVAELLRWQWADYGATHRNRVNLAVHLLAVPLFMVGCVLVVLGVMRGPSPVAAGALAVLIAIGLQGIGHKLEAERPEPFTGFADFARRFVLEQWVTFPRYVVSGGWLEGYKS